MPRPWHLAPLRLGTVLLVVAGWAAPVAAYRRSTVDDVPGGLPLFWEESSIEIRIASGSVPGLEPAQMALAFHASSRTWSLAGGCTRIRLLDGGEVTGLATNLTQSSPDRENRIVFRASDWPPELGPETLALTTAVYRRGTGQIVDADIDLNAVDHVWSTGTPALEGHDDVENTLTHELGHVLGFAHSEEPTATMFASAPVGELGKRDLAEDDINAVCDVYPGGTPRGVRSSCALAPSGPEGLGPWASLGAALGLVALARRRRA